MKTVGDSWNKDKWKKCSERRKHCAMAVARWSQKFSPRCRPLPGGTGWPKFNQLEMVTTFIYKPCLVKIDAHNFSYCGNRPTHKQTGPITPLNLACSVNSKTFTGKWRTIYIAILTVNNNIHIHKTIHNNTLQTRVNITQTSLALKTSSNPARWLYCGGVDFNSTISNNVRKPEDSERPE